MTTQPRKRAKKQTVAKEGTRAHKDQTVAEPSPDVVEKPTPTMATEPKSPDVVLAVDDADKGFCDNKDGRRAIVVTNFPWVKPQRFCNVCLPPQYRYLVP